MSAPWHANFPAGKSNPPEISAAELAALSGPGKEYIVVDVRRTDIDSIREMEGHPTVGRHVHLPVPTLPGDCQAASHCAPWYAYVADSSGAGREDDAPCCYQPAGADFLSDGPQLCASAEEPGGRGPRCAAWYQDYLDENGIKSSQALVLKGGYKAWAAEFPDRVVKL
ncbi:hypothetical protein A1Q1_05029 [Trichosporon asahii var. asahii CBS 2479]|uniref:Rhodanese domain-containing protein n=1 Tax=Trichosporon asahii var. asahii (strain ATCC 90039 / CBS 2479 / JCM 2466 / KCTC 7840 / NBRC 103889/ NCYC 2677 / UAMH 7654) TaxID=1186058 RepID=J6EUB8_TRIAS|nr:hypothetical protein A1Q1_05029 [Trichosporon asahii var. asahii CBS 2479]EJT46382.1 hypothetical protein A1Q1_05029 [Trichosporon asahii var. asahii CBS 2479]